MKRRPTLREISLVTEALVRARRARLPQRVDFFRRSLQKLLARRYGSEEMLDNGRRGGRVPGGWG